MRGKFKWTELCASLRPGPELPSSASVFGVRWALGVLAVVADVGSVVPAPLSWVRSEDAEKKLALGCCFLASWREVPAGGGVCGAEMGLGVLSTLLGAERWGTAGRAAVRGGAGPSEGAVASGGTSVAEMVGNPDGSQQRPCVCCWWRECSVHLVGDSHTPGRSRG